MGLGSSTPQPSMFFMRPRSKETKEGPLKPHFSVKKKEKDGSITELPNETKVSGFLMGISHKEYEYPEDSGTKVKAIVIMLVDGEDVFKIDIGMNSNMGRGVMNKLLASAEMDTIALSIYKSKAGDYVEMYITNNDQPTGWKFDYKESIAPLITEAPDPQREGKTVKVYHAVNRMLWDEWLKHESAVQAYAKAKGYAPSAKAPSVAVAVASGGLQSEFDDQPDHGAPPIDQEPPFAPDGSPDDLPF